MNRLEELLPEAFKDPASRPRFYHALLDSEIYVFVITHNNKSPSKDVQFLYSNDPKVGASVPFFSSLDQLQKLEGFGRTYAKMNSSDFFKATKGNTLILNPGSEFGKVFLSEEIEALLDGSLFAVDEQVQISAGTSYVLGQPKEHPKELINALTSLFGSHNKVKKAFLGQITYIDQKPPLTAIVIGIDVGRDKKTFLNVIKDAGFVARPLLAEGQAIDFVDLSTNGGIALSLKDTTPFYRKKSFQLW